jgi:multimeric flavodoxin WrbA
MKIIAFNGSPRGSLSNTYTMVESFLHGAAGAGAEVEQVLLSEKNIHPCRGCFACWAKTPGQCVIKDDMTELLEKIKIADIIVFATPLYFFNMTGIMKNFMDRIIPLGDPHFAPSENGLCRHVNARNNTAKFVIISNCGFPEQEHFKVLHELFATCVYQMHGKILAEIYRGGGAILHDAPLLLKPIVHRYKKLLEEAGGQVVRDGKLTEELMENLAKPLIPIDMYIKHANQHFDDILRQIKQDKKA